MTNNAPSGAKKHRESTEPESRQTAKIFLLRKITDLEILLVCGERLKKSSAKFCIGSLQRL